MKKEDILLIVAFVAVAISFIGVVLTYMTPIKPSLIGFVTKSGDSQSRSGYTLFGTISFLFLLFISIIFLLKKQKNAKKKKRNSKK